MQMTKEITCGAIEIEIYERNPNSYRIGRFNDKLTQRVTYERENLIKLT